MTSTLLSQATQRLFAQTRVSYHDQKKRPWCIAHR